MWWKGPFVGHLAPGAGLLLWGASWLAYALGYVQSSSQPSAAAARAAAAAALPQQGHDTLAAGRRRRAARAAAAAGGGAALTGVPAAARGGGDAAAATSSYVARGCFSGAELRVRALASLLALATEAASARANAGGRLVWCGSGARARAQTANLHRSCSPLKRKPLALNQAHALGSTPPSSGA
jgi:hypothetical protein